MCSAASWTIRSDWSEASSRAEAEVEAVFLSLRAARFRNVCRTSEMMFSSFGVRSLSERNVVGQRVASDRDRAQRGTYLLLFASAGLMS